MYHLSAESERKAEISEAIRVTKLNGIVFMAYILNEMTVINYFFRNGHINEADAREKIKEGYAEIIVLIHIFSFE